MAEGKPLNWVHAGKITYEARANCGTEIGMEMECTWLLDKRDRGYSEVESKITSRQLIKPEKLATHTCIRTPTHTRR